MNRNNVVLLFACISLVPIGRNAQPLAQGSIVSWSTLDMGFEASSSVNTEVKSAFGQMFVGSSQQANTRVESGFLADTFLRGILVSVPDQRGLPLAFSLKQNFPNPFNPATTIRYELPKTSRVKLKIYNLLGQDVAVVVDESKPAGKYEVHFDGANLPSGVYFYRLSAGEFVEIKKMLVVR